MSKIYENPVILEYLRYHPYWYKILYYDNSRLNEFLNTAKEELKITLRDKLDGFRNQLDFVTSLIDYINKKWYNFIWSD